MGLTTLIKVPSQKDFYDGTQWERKPHGTILLGDKEVAHTLMCPHCGNHFISRKGSGVRRGFCMGCKAVTCGDVACGPCIPFEKRLEIAEEIGRILQKG